ncbi:DUF1904 family protein [Paenibacillus sp. LHD-117]|uniref:DUF1904 family protein n=1 Tax=Paenibacillus sp. LHD-117 TaxID=3071412 RepID=UPI0027E015B6|nr:DUF1904 family protein [Paenibacillus sp. LHD-117]MDQ6423421.1 DUF1904 family protein [Paenibacillus sp. LHD-117]
MPHLVFRGVPAERLKSAAVSLAEELAAICDCGTDNFTMNVINATSVFGDGSDDPAFAFVEVGWFDRGKQARNRFAEAVTHTVLQLGIPDVEIVFHAYREDSYYINGKPVE